MTNFERAVDHVFAREGGFVFHPLDRGGPTKFGVTQRILGQFRNALVSDQDVKDLTQDEARKVYASMFWNAAKLERVRDADTALILFDFAIHAGPETAIKLLQRVLNRNFSEKLIVDGDLGNKTFTALCTSSEPRLNRKLIQAMQTHYVRIVELNSTQLVFLEGWVNRSHKVWDSIA